MTDSPQQPGAPLNAAPRPKPVFFSHSGRRWRAVSSVLRLAAVVFIFIGAAGAIAVFQESGVVLPRLNEAEIYKQVLNPDQITTFATRSNKTFSKLRKNFPAVEPTPAQTVGVHPDMRAPLRIGFFVNWDAQAFASLKANIANLNVVMPEWLFIPDSGNEITLDIHARALALMEEHGVAIMPMISNFSKGKFNGDNVHRIISSKSNRHQFIQSILNTLEKYKFAGINIDFEDLKESSDEDLIQFQRELYGALHARKYVVSQDVAPSNADYDFRRLQRFNDFLLLMAYDMHFATSRPGPVADTRWVERVIQAALEKHVPPSKLVLGIAAYGYDWPVGAEATDVTFQEAVVTARESEGTIQFDNDTSNLTFNYDDENDHPHEVWFTDAGTAFNLMRIAARYELSGVALWRLGSEDSRIWRFFKRELSDQALANDPLDQDVFGHITSGNDIDYQGEGEILDVIATPQDGVINYTFDDHLQLITEESYQKLPSTYVVRKFGLGKKQVLLTFDDGPDQRYTGPILDILKRENIKATFFIVGLNAERNLPLLRRIYDEGHEIGNHSFTHPNLAETGKERLTLELNATRRIIESITGRSTVLFRPPFNADSEPETLEEILPVAAAKRDNYYTVGESIDPRDWEPDVTADEIMQRIEAQQRMGSIVLLHDSGGDRTETVKALPRIIDYYRKRGDGFTTVSTLLGKSRDDVMPPLTNRRDVFLSHLNWGIVELLFRGQYLLSATFILAILLAVSRTIAIAICAAIQRQYERHEEHDQVPLTSFPLVSVIVPAYNEQVTAPLTVRNVLLSDYPNLEVIVVDDGSSDDTLATLTDRFMEDKRVVVLTKPNGGKASALNLGIERAHGELLVCIDADTQLALNAVSALVPVLQREGVGAVAGNVRVGNEHNLLTCWQAIEYITSQNFDRRAFDLLNAVTVVPGAIGGFKRAAVVAAGGFTHDTLAEDCDLTLRILMAGFRVHYVSNAIAYTEAPDTIKMFLKQRFRWAFGILQCIWKHRDAMGRRRYGALGLIALPNIIIFQFMLPLIAPLADLLIIFALAAGFWERALLFYLVFTLIDAIASAIAFSFEREPMWRLWLLFPQRIGYRFLLCWVVLRALLSALKGGLVGWGTLQRRGNVTVAGAA